MLRGGGLEGGIGRFGSWGEVLRVVGSVGLGERERERLRDNRYVIMLLIFMME